MIAMISTAAPRAANRSKFAAQVIGVVAALGMATGCVTNDNGSPTNQTTGTFLGALLVTMLTNGLLLLRIGEFWVQACLGLVLLLAVLMDKARRSFLAARRIA